MEGLLDGILDGILVGICVGIIVGIDVIVVGNIVGCDVNMVGDMDNGVGFNVGLFVVTHLHVSAQSDAPWHFLVLLSAAEVNHIAQ